MRRVLAVVVLALAWTGQALAQRTLMIDLVFEEESVRVNRVQRIAAAPPRYLGFAQGEPLFFELLGGKGQVLYAEPLHDPRLVVIKAGPDAQPGPNERIGPLIAKVGRTYVFAPAIAEAREVRVCRRDEAGRRRVIGRGGL
jgi:hypothetical protein